MHPVVIVVDDNLVNQQLIEWTLEGEAEVHSISSGRACCALAGKLNANAIFLDLMMPDYSGFDVLEELKAKAPGLLSRTVVITARDDEAARTKAESYGIAAYQKKPIEIEDVHRLLALASSAA